MEFGLFIFFTVVGALGYWKNSNMYLIAVAIVAFFITALLLATDGQVVQTHVLNMTKTSRDANGTLTGTEIDNGNNQDVIFSSYTLTVSYIYYGFAALATLLFMWRSMKLPQTGKY